MSLLIFVIVATMGLSAIAVVVMIVGVKICEAWQWRMLSEERLRIEKQKKLNEMSKKRRPF